LLKLNKVNLHIDELSQRQRPYYANLLTGDTFKVKLACLVRVRADTQLSLTSCHFKTKNAYTFNNKPNF